MSHRDEQVFKSLGVILRQAREKEGMTQTQVAEAVKINANFYAMVERGEKNISYRHLRKILKVLHVKSLDIS